VTPPVAPPETLPVAPPDTPPVPTEAPPDTLPPAVAPPPTDCAIAPDAASAMVSMEAAKIFFIMANSPLVQSLINFPTEGRRGCSG
ncbi:hypothetical protein EN792_071830, partial [Mesorhizobium sp. M00.F.Ca.ET.149.01.1.1]